MKKLNIAIIGLGNILPMHLASILNIDDVRLCGVCDIKEDRAKSFSEKYNVPYYTDYKKLITELKPDAVHILTPHYLHISMAQFALNNGVNVLSEKPMSIKLEDAEQTVALASEKKLQYGVIFQCRYNTASQLVKKHITDGSLGKVICARSVLTWSRKDSYYGLSDWKGTWDKEGGGVIIDQAIHSIDLVNWFIGDEFESVSANLSNRNHKIMTVDDTAEGLIKYKNGAIYGFWAMNNYSIDEPIEIRLYCENGKATLSYDEAKIEFKNGEVLTANQNMDNKIHYENAKDYWGFQHIKQIRQFYDSLLGRVELQISGAEALKTQRLINAIYATLGDVKSL